MSNQHEPYRVDSRRHPFTSTLARIRHTRAMRFIVSFLLAVYPICCINILVLVPAGLIIHCEPEYVFLVAAGTAAMMAVGFAYRRTKP